MKASDKVEITVSEYRQLLKDSLTLAALECYGVDNWIGCEDCFDDEYWAEMKKVSDKWGEG